MAAFSISIIMFSFLGLPPLAGFFGKMYLFLAALQAEYFTLAIIGVLSSVIAAFYYIRIIKVMFFSTSPFYNTYKRLDKNNAIVLSSSLFFIIFFFAYPHPFLMVSHSASLFLCL